MEINKPAVLAEMQAAFQAYERALVTNDVDMLGELFWDDPRTIRYGAGENLYGHEAIQGFRAARSPQGLERSLEGTVVTTYGDDFATASTLFRRESAAGRLGRQMQTWMRTPAGWRVVAAHLSFIDEPRP